MPDNLWNEQEAARQPDLAGLVYRSNLLGREPSVVNVYGGNTSVKLAEVDHLGRQLAVLWVKGSGSDLAAMDAQGFAGLRQADLLPLLDRASMSDAQMVDYLARCTFALGRPRQSIETLLHAFIPARHVDHTHPDAVISLACVANGRQLCQELWGRRMVWVDYLRPGFALSKQIGLAVHTSFYAGDAPSPGPHLVVMGKHGLVTWGDDSRQCYANTIRVIQDAEDFIARRRTGPIFPGVDIPALDAARRRQILAEILPRLRGLLSQQQPAILQMDDSPAVLAFVGSQDAATLSQVGAACPDHLVHTKRQPLFVDWSPADGIEILVEKLAAGVSAFIADYTAYFQEHSRVGDQMHDPGPRVILIPGLGMITAGSDIGAADVARQLYGRAIAVMDGSQTVGRFTSLSAQESFDVEYWPLELHKLSLKPSPRELAGRVALVTGGASGIGRAVAHRLAQDGAHVAILDIDLAGAQQVADALVAQHGRGRGLALHCDVTSEEAVARAFEAVVLAYGGVDVVVSNAGIAFGAPIDETTVADWHRTVDVLAKGYFLVSREAFKLWKAQALGGSLIFVSSKNALAASKNNAVYGAAKAAELHMARCLAEEGGGVGIRVNSVLPYAVIEGSRIWGGGFGQARAAAYGIAPEQLDEYYRQQTTLKVNVYAEHVAEAVSFLAGPRASRTTGGMLAVDGGVGAAYAR